VAFAQPPQAFRVTVIGMPILGLGSAAKLARLAFEFTLAKQSRALRQHYRPPIGRYCSTEHLPAQAIAGSDTFGCEGRPGGIEGAVGWASMEPKQESLIRIKEILL
jgi:hypothetical protein